MTTIFIAFISIISLLVLHELGHFVIAKKLGVKVEEFGIGYPPRLIGKRFGETLYSLNLLPFGAFVKIPGADSDESTVEDDRRFTRKPAWQRALILLGGVVSFWIVAFILLSIVFGIGASVAISDEEAGPLVNPRVQILSVSSGSPAEKAGIKVGDTINQFSISELPQEAKEKKMTTSSSLSNLQFPINKVKEVQELTEQYKGQEVILTIQRGKEIFTLSLIPRVAPPAGEGSMGVSLVRTAEESYPWWQTPVKGMAATANLTSAVIRGWGEILGNLIRGEGLPKGVQFMGPVGIGNLINQAARVGINYFLQFIAIISIYLAVFNLLPIPALDGGKLLFLGIEKIKGSPINQKIEQNLTSVVFAILVVLMVWVTIKDISHLF